MSCRRRALRTARHFKWSPLVVLDGSGNIIAGESTFDFLDPNTGSVTSSTGAIVATGSSYFLGPDGRGSITINSSNNSIGPQTFSLAYLSNAHLFVGAQPSNNNPLIVSASGTMDLQTTTGLSDAFRRVCLCLEWYRF